MDRLKSENIITFNGPLEAGIRMVYVLYSVFPQQYDLQRLTALDFLLIKTGEIGGPDNMHPSAPFNNPATEVRRKVVQTALNLMITKDLISQEIHSDGIFYKAGECAAFFVNSLQSEYHQELRTRAQWLTEYLSEYSDTEFESLIKRFFKNWVSEFQVVEKSLGSEN